MRIAPSVKIETANAMKNMIPTKLLVPPKEFVDEKYNPLWPLN